MKNLNPSMTQQYADKADHFFHGMELLFLDLKAYRTGIGLLAIHSAISLSDAIKVGLTGKPGKYDDHMQAAKELDRLRKANGVKNANGIAHLSWLLSHKSAVAYQHDRIDDNSVRLAREKAERFNAWAYNHFKEILRGV